MNIAPSLWFRLAVGASILVLAYLFLPALVVIPISLTDRYYLSMPAQSLSLAHYLTLFTDPMWRDSFIQTVFVSATSTVLALAFGSMAAIGAWKMGARMGNLVRILALMPLVVPTIVGALAYYRLYIRLGLLDTFTGVIITHVVAAIPFVFITVSAALGNFDVKLEQAARSMGAGPLQVLARITLPCIRPGLISGAIFAFIVSWDELVILLFVTMRNVYLLPRAMWDGVNDNVDPAIAGVATLMMAVTLLCLFTQRWLARHTKGRN